MWAGGPAAERAERQGGPGGQARQSRGEEAQQGGDGSFNVQVKENNWQAKVLFPSPRSSL